MPSQKHKKKKKSHKHHKKRSSSGSADESRVWKVHFSYSDSDEPKSEARLTSLVRESYMNHLKQALANNFEGQIKNSDGSYQDAIPELVNKWSFVLEQKALRTCMMSELYRTSMVALIRQIKSSTSNGTLYVEEKSLNALQQMLPLNKEAQTDRSNVCVNVAQTQTEPTKYSLLELPLPDCLSPSSRPYDPAIKFFDSPSVNRFTSGAGVSSSFYPKQTQAANKSPSSHDACNITSTSDFVDPAQFIFGDVKTTDITNAFDTLGIPLRTNPNNCCDKDQLILKNCESESIPNTMDTSEASVKNHSSGDFNQNVPQKKMKRVQYDNYKKNSKDNLDSRLTAMGLLSDVGSETDDTTPQLPLVKSKKSNWFAEEVAQSCNLTRILLKMSSKHRDKVLKRIKELFGDEDELLMELTEKNITICRKRIASVVVMELTPIYQEKRIASRYLFKFLAKKITKALMDQSYAPDTRSIRWKVKEFFSDGKVIMSESDCI